MISYLFKVLFQEKKEKNEAAKINRDYRKEYKR